MNFLNHYESIQYDDDDEDLIDYYYCCCCGYSKNNNMILMNDQLVVWMKILLPLSMMVLIQQLMLDPVSVSHVVLMAMIVYRSIESSNDAYNNNQSIN
ncbi:hypothetical protein DERF_014912 [Dermatophagoides farinae]|uniref:Uncharacterized protein n=1 Tax=Dermatophagoides farinae TaxID=6954 RepID=A0A922HK59_DERFA|nr:hypothetical protein DERF_014912 [Dermatophagoides farinae]